MRRNRASLDVHLPPTPFRGNANREQRLHLLDRVRVCTVREYLKQVESCVLTGRAAYDILADIGEGQGIEVDSDGNRLGVTILEKDLELVSGIFHARRVEVTVEKEPGGFVDVTFAALPDGPSNSSILEEILCEVWGLSGRAMIKVSSLQSFHKSP